MPWRFGRGAKETYEHHGERVHVEPKITTEHSASSYGQPVLVRLDDGEADDKEQSMLAHWMHGWMGD